MPTPASTPAPASLVDDICFEHCVIRPAQRDVLVGGKPAKLGARAFDVLLTLVEHRDRTISKHELLEIVWPGIIVEENNLQVQISTLRKLLGPQVISTIPGRGYRFTVALDDDVTVAESLPAASAANSAVTVSSNGNLPATAPTLFGRDADIVALAKQVAAHRIVTVVGSGGLGKTRLAQAAAHLLRDAQTYADGVWLVELAPVSDPALLPAAVAQALGITLPGKTAAQDELIDALRNRALLLVLDNCEHVVAVVSSLARAVVDYAPQVSVLATSQESLRVAREQLYRLAPLALPAPPDVSVSSAAHVLVSAQASGAVALFVERASALQRGFTLTDNNVACVVDICRRLDGLPLAIELAAARVPVLGVAGINQRLNERFRLLTGGARGAPRRHHTLREMFDWSHSLLSADERAVFRRAGVFVGGFTLLAAQHALADGALDQWAVLDHLGALVDKSLLVADASEPPRYRLLESARAYALEKLLDGNETQATLARHAQAVLMQFEQADARRWTEPSQRRLELLLPELDNLRSALDWAADSDAATHIALTGLSAWIWPGAGQRVEGLRRLQQALARVDASTAPALEARLQQEWAELVYPYADASANAASARAISLYRNLNDRRGLFLALRRHAVESALSGALSESEQATLEMTQLFDPTWPLVARWSLLISRLFFLYCSARYEEAQPVAEDCLRIATAARNSELIRSSLLYLEQIAAAQGRYDEAVWRGRELVVMARRDRFGRSTGQALGYLCVSLTCLGELDEALTVAREANAFHSQNGTLWDCLDVFALLAFKRGRFTEAAQARGRADAVATRRGARREPNAARVRNDVLTLLQEALAADELDRLLAQGAQLSDEEAARLALAD